MSIRQALKEDAQFYRKLKFGERAAGLRAWLVWLTSTGLFLLAMHRAANAFQKLRAAQKNPIKRAALRVLLTTTRPLVLFRGKSDISGATLIAPGVYLSDRGQLVIGARSIGTGTIIHHAVTIGMSTMNHGTPQIGANVWIGPDCVVYGNIEIGDGATLLPGTVLSKSIPPRCVVKGNPGRVMEMGFDNSSLRSTLRWDVEMPKLKSS
jgi:serine O-acetyltransferase